MAKYLILWNAGCGEEFELQEHPDEDAAREAAYETWRQATEDHADYSAKPMTAELAEEYGFAEDEWK